MYGQARAGPKFSEVQEGCKAILVIISLIKIMQKIGYHVKLSKQMIMTIQATH